MRSALLIVAVYIALGASPIQGKEPAPAGRAAEAVEAIPRPLRLSLDDCLEMARQGSLHRQMARLDLEAAEARRGQAHSIRWPQAVLQSAFLRRDDHPLFILPEQTDTYTMAGVLPQPIQAEITVPARKIRLLDRTLFAAFLDLEYPLFTGGLRPALERQASAGVEAARQEARHTDLQLVCEVTRVYYGGVLARDLVRTGEEALARLTVTLDFTEGLYRKGSGRIQKTDYLEHRIAVESLRSVLASLRYNERLARAALANAIGLAWDAEVEPADEEIPFVPCLADLQGLVGEAYRFSPDWARMKAGLEAYEAGVQQARSGHRPKLALIGRLDWLANAYDAGIVGPEARKAWTAGIGMELPLFDGFRTDQEIREARVRLERLEQQELLLREGLALQVKSLFLRLQCIEEQERAAREALAAASEDRDLTVRAYQNELAEVQDLVKAQLLEAVMKAQYQKVRYDHVGARAQLELAVGRELAAWLQEQKP